MPPFFCLFMLIMSFVHSSIANAYLSGNGLAVQQCDGAGGRERGSSAAGTPGPRVSREKLHLREIYASGGGLLMAPHSCEACAYTLVGLYCCSFCQRG